MIQRFLDTLGFLTRLAPARVISDEDMNKCMKFMPAAGLFLGAVIVVPFWLGLFSASAWVQAWLMVGLNVYLTRGLHFDGLGDVCDAVTTHGDPDRFWEVVKDSRAGAFGVIGLIMAIGGQVLLFREMIVAGNYTAVIWAFVLGRGACVGFAYRIKHLARPGLGKLYIDGATLPVSVICGGVVFALGVFMIGPVEAIAAMCIASLGLFFLYRLAESVGGANGDFLGCSVLMGELAAGLGFVLLL